MNQSNNISSNLPLLDVRKLTRRFVIRKAGWRHPAEHFTAVREVDLRIRRGETFGIVGESGCGKTTLARCVMRAMKPTHGVVEFDTGQGVVDLAKLSERQLKPLRKSMQMIFQDPYSSLNPRMTVGDIVAEPLLIHRMGTRRQRRDRVAAMLERVGLSADHMNRYPHAFSGGQRQRIGIARAIVVEPSFVVADEAVSALDVSVQAQVLDLLKDLQREMGLTYVFVSHDLSVVRHFCDRVAVMYGGQIVERGDAMEVFDRPQHPYTKVLISAIPYPDPDRKMQPLRVEDLTPQQMQPLAYDASEHH